MKILIFAGTIFRQIADFTKFSTHKQKCPLRYNGLTMDLQLATILCWGISSTHNYFIYRFTYPAKIQKYVGIDGARMHEVHSQ